MDKRKAAGILIMVTSNPDSCARMLTIVEDVSLRKYFPFDSQLTNGKSRQCNHDETAGILKITYSKRNYE